eukprot:scaffold10059_cov123-Isochrysis_galbana.AAC.3
MQTGECKHGRFALRMLRTAPSVPSISLGMFGEHSPDESESNEDPASASGFGRRIVGAIF